ncbi:MAG: phosphatase PAP2 family protein [Alloprevotella sp.]|nr:phosphatase PAP2 family protein [Alloprevotella sp.]
MKPAAILLIALITLAGTASAQSRRAVNRATDVACLTPVVAGVAVSLIQKDYKGSEQFGLSLGTTLAANYLLELSIKKSRPDGTGRHAFPSTHTAVAFASATFIGRRYGWKWSIPAYAVAGGVAWGRVYAKKHDFWDVLAGAAIGTGSALIFTRPKKKGMTWNAVPIATPEGTGLSVCATF